LLLVLILNLLLLLNLLSLQEVVLPGSSSNRVHRVVLGRFRSSILEEGDRELIHLRPLLALLVLLLLLSQEILSALHQILHLLDPSTGLVVVA